MNEMQKQRFLELSPDSKLEVLYDKIIEIKNDVDSIKKGDIWIEINGDKKHLPKAIKELYQRPQKTFFAVSKYATGFVSIIRLLEVLGIGVLIWKVFLEK